MLFQATLGSFEIFFKFAVVILFISSNFSFGFIGFLAFQNSEESLKFSFFFFFGCDLKSHLKFTGWVSLDGISGSINEILSKITWSGHFIPSHLKKSAKSFDFYGFLAGSLGVSYLFLKSMWLAKRRL